MRKLSPFTRGYTRGTFFAMLLVTPPALVYGVVWHRNIFVWLACESMVTLIAALLILQRYGWEDDE